MIGLRIIVFIIKAIMTDEDRKALEYMLSLEYAMPYQLLKTKNNRRKIIYIMTPVLFLLSIGCYFGNIFHNSSCSFLVSTNIYLFQQRIPISPRIHNVISFTLYLLRKLQCTMIDHFNLLSFLDIYKIFPLITSVP